MRAARYRRSCGFSTIVRSCIRRYFVGPIFFVVFCEYKIFSRGYFVGLKLFSWVFVGPKYFLVGISWVQNIFSWVFVGPKFFLADTFWTQNFSREYFVGPIFFFVLRGSNFFVVVDFVIERFSVAGCMSKSDLWQKYTNTSTFLNHVGGKGKMRCYQTYWDEG